MLQSFFPERKYLDKHFYIKQKGFLLQKKACLFDFKYFFESCSLFQQLIYVPFRSLWLQDRFSFGLHFLGKAHIGFNNFLTVKNKLLLLVVEHTLLSSGQVLNPVAATHMHLKRICAECDYWLLEVFKILNPSFSLCCIFFF